MSVGNPSQTAQAQKSADVSTHSTSSSDLGIESTNIQNARQKMIVGSVRLPLPPILARREFDAGGIRIVIC